MTETYLILILTYIVFSIALVLVFSFSNGRLRGYHNKCMIGLLVAIAENKDQMEIRSKGLDRYDLLRYNIDESLIIQEEISIEIK